ncbi:hypothetical protein BHU72_08940 [Desulfuribacillus stibiiarsenatis]|uniref:Major facilitator superfamily (MFS) profile domain-containing protein n=1 Tax=Desulfuribacillus stibiiarsenatis TaxID=1390249 RepID=A0A1E5L3G6_9FIRM|nr:MFS transporter [Desulfuribacillus stibiiarsenatis]OEH84611.1 hypothetical protein BHU72_08940 [Desulfuribacillus stibiiarsenatis]
MNRLFISYNWLLFFGIGSLYPLLAIYLEEVGLSGAQIGVILSIGPIVTIFAQPFWGYLSDRFQRPIGVITLTATLSAITVLGYLLLNHYIHFIVVAVLLALFHSPLVPISDSITLGYVKKHGVPFGNIRLWGAIGFALAVWITGFLMEFTFSGIIFYVFSIVLILTAILARWLPNEAEYVRTNFKQGISKLFRLPAYCLLLISTFLIFGAVHANNFYFGIYYTSIGGTVAGVGVVFLLAAGSEAPVMRIANYYISKFGLANILIFASSIGALRWFFFSMEPSSLWVVVVSISQGISVGLFIPASVMLVRELSPDDVKVTSMAIFSSAGTGLGTTFFTVLSGYIIEMYTPSSIYLLYGIASLVGITSLFFMKVYLIQAFQGERLQN